MTLPPVPPGVTRRAAYGQRHGCALHRLAAVLREGNMAHRRLAHERPDHQLAFSVLVITLRVLAITLPLLALAVLAAIFGGSGDPGTADLVFIGRW